MKYMKLVWVFALFVAIMAAGAWLIQGTASSAQANTPTPTATPTWPPKYENLSKSNNKSVYPKTKAVRLNNGEKVVVVAWTESTDAEKVSGSIAMKWKFQNGDWMYMPGSYMPQERGTTKYSYVSLDVQPETTQVKAHLVWILQDGEYSQVQYAMYTLTKSGYDASPPAFEQVSPNDKALWAQTSPDIALDASGDPHVVWAVNPKSGGDGAIYYNSKLTDDPWPGGGWEVGWGKVDRPVIDISPDNLVYVAWENNTSGEANLPGINLRRRDSGAAGIKGTWTPSDYAGVRIGKDYTEGGQPLAHPDIVVDTVSNGAVYPVYVMWDQRVASDSGAAPPFNTYVLGYQVLTGTDVTQNWWPGANNPIHFARVFTTTTTAPRLDKDEFYLGLRPSIDVISHTLYVAWQGVDMPGVAAMEQAQVQSALSPQSEAYIQDFKIIYSLADHSTLPLAPQSIQWGGEDNPPTMTIRISKVYYWDQYPVFTNPSLSVIPGYNHLHVGVSKRFPLGSTFAWDVWYANNVEFPYYPEQDPYPPDGPPTIYLPLIMRAAK